MIIVRRGTSKDSAGIAKVQVDSWKSTYQGILSQEILDQLTYEKHEETWNKIFSTGKKEFNFVAENEAGSIVAFIDGGKERTKDYSIEAELYALYILEDYQRKGVGSRLINQFVSAIKGSGFSSMMVWVFKDNPSRKFYEAFNPQLLTTEYIEELGVDEVAYAWEDLTLFHAE